MAKRPDLEVSLSPQYETMDTSRNNRDRSTSFVEAELYSEADNSQLSGEEMEKWKGFQLDMRKWRNSSAIGPIVSL